MNNQVSLILKKIIFFNFLIGTLITIIIYYFLGNYAFVFLLGLSISIFNFLINGLVTSFLLKKGKSNKVLLLLAFIFRVVIVCLVAIFIISINEYNIVPYVLGYCSQFIGLIIYGITINSG